MLAAMQLLEDKPGAIRIGYEEGSQSNAIADGNIRGTYGHSRPVAEPRDFLGLPEPQIEAIYKKYEQEAELRARLQEIDGFLVDGENA